MVTDCARRIATATTMSSWPPTPIRRLAALADPTSDETELLGAFRYSRNLAVLHSDAEFHAAAPRGLVELELYRLARWIRRQRRRHLLDEPAARHSGRYAAVSHPQSAAPAARRDAASQRGLRSSDLRRRRDIGAAPALVAARQGQCVVLRRTFRRGFSRGRIAGRPRRRRATRRAAAAVERARRVRTHRAWTRGRGSRPCRSCSDELPIGALCRGGDASAAAAHGASVSLPRLLAADRPR